MLKQLLLSLALVGFAAHAAASGQTYRIDPEHSYGNFEIGHLGLSTMQGRIDVTKGTLVLDRQGNKSRVEVSLDPASVDTGHKERDEHLRSEKGFFEVDKFPGIRFVSTQVNFEEDDEATVDGKLTLHGVTRPVTLDVDDIRCKADPLEKSQYRCGFSAETEIQRSDFGMGAFIPLVSDEVEISIEAEATRPRDAG